MSANERLGIELYVEAPKDDASQFLTKLSNQLEQISKALDGVDLSKIGKGGDSTAKATKAVAEEVKKVGDEAEKAAKKAELISKGIVPVEGSWGKFVKANKDAALAITEDWHKAQQLMSESYKKFNADRVATVEKTEKAVRSSLAETLKVEEKNNEVRAAIVRARQTAEDQSLANQIKNAEKQRDIWSKFKAKMDAEDRNTARMQVNAGIINDSRSVFMSGVLAKDADGHIQLRAKTIRDAEENLGDQIVKINQRTNAAIRANNVATARQRQLDLSQIIASNVNQQLDWNRQAGTQGVKYQAVDGGFVRASVQTQNLNYDALTRIHTEANKINSAFDNAGSSVSFFAQIFGKSVGSMLGRLTEFYSLRTLIFAISGAFKEASGSIIDLGQSVHDIAAISGAPLTSMQAMSDSIMSIAKTSRFTSQEISDLMQVLAQAGVKEKDLPGVARATGIFATASASKPGLAADLVTTSMNVFGLDASKTTRIINTLTAALNESKLETQGLATAFNYLAPQAAQLGMSLEQTAGFIATMSQAGVKPSTIGTGGSQLLKELSAPKGRLKALLEEKHINAEDISPRLNSFDQIADKFKESGVSAERLFQTLDTRVARSLVTALTLGGDAFRLMTENITGTSAALVANAKAMDGPRAKINVLKQEFADVIKSMSDGGVGKILSVSIGLITDFVRGLNTTTGALYAAGVAVAGFGTAAVVSFRAIQLALAGLNLTAMAGPLGWIAGLTVAIGAGVIALGHYTKSEQHSAEESVKSYTKKAEALDQYQKLVNKARIEAEANNSEIKNAGELYAKEGKAGAEKLKIWNQTVTVSSEIRTEMKKLKESYPELLKYYDTELKYVNSLYEAKGKAAKFNLNARAAEEYNRALAQSNFDKKQYDEAKAIVDKGTPKDPQGRMGYLVAMETVRKFPAKEKQNNEILTTLSTGKDFDFTPGGFALAKLDTSEAGKVIPAKPNDLIDEDAKKKHDRDKHISDSNVNFAIALIEARIAKKKAELEVRKLELKTDEDLKKYKQDAILLLEEENALEKRKLELQAAKQAASAVHGTVEFNSDNRPAHIIPDYKGKYSNKQAEDAAKKAQQVLDAQVESTDLNTRNSIEKVNQTKLPLHKDTTVSDEKKAALRLKDELAALNLQKQRVTSASELHAIDVKILDANIKNEEKLKSIFEKEQENIVKDVQKYKDTEEYNKALDTTGDRLAEITSRLKEMKTELSRLKDDSWWHNFSEGVRSAWVELSNQRSMTQQLGSNITNTAFNGFANSAVDTMWMGYTNRDANNKLRQEIADLNRQKAELEGSIASSSNNKFKSAEEIQSLNQKKIALDGVNKKLAEQKQVLAEQSSSWQNFGKALQNIMVDILKEIQKYLIKMAAVSIVNRVIGIFDKGGVKIMSPQDIDVSGKAATGGLVTTSGMRRFAEGGVIDATLGGFIPKLPGTEWGKDGVPILSAPGEIIIKKSSVDYYGADKLLALNDKKLQRFADGGLVGGSSRNSSGSGTGEKSLVIVNVADVNSIPQQPVDAQQVINIVSFDAARRGPTYHTIKSVASG